MGDSMVEKVARAIKPEWWGEIDGVHPLDNYPQQHKNYQELAMKEARAALEACHFEELVEVVEAAARGSNILATCKKACAVLAKVGDSSA